MRIVIFGLPYSANVGDGVIAECLAHALRAARPGVTVDLVDLSGRTGFGAATLRNRALVLAVLARLPLVLRQRLVIWRLGRMLDGLRPGWEKAARGADLAIIGGGQLFSDADLNFCLKIAQAADVLQGAGVPVVVHGVGVSRNWTQRGKALFARLFAADLRAVGVRDELSRTAWENQTDGASPAPRLTRDPGLLAARCYARPAAPAGRVGLCVTAPMILAYHADGGIAGGSGLGFFASLAVVLAGQARGGALFCNGAAEDRAALAQVAAHPDVAPLITAGKLSLVPPPETPAELVEAIGGLSGVIAHRLHACIVAHAFGVPAVGLGWDRKLDSFFASVDRSGFFVDDASATPQAIALLCDMAIAQGIDAARHAQVIAETQQQIAALFDLVTPALKPPSPETA